MRVLITTDLYSTATNGVVTSIKNLIAALEAQGHEVRVLTLSNSLLCRKTNSEYYLPSIPLGIYPNIRMTFFYRHKYIKELIKWNPDIIHSQCEFFTLNCAKKIARKTGAPIVHTFHTIYEYYVGYIPLLKKIGNKLTKWFVRNRLKRISGIIVPTEKIKSLLLSYGMEKPIYIVPSGIFLERHKVRLSAEDRAEKRREMGVADDMILLIYLGRIALEKNLRELVDYYAKSSGNNAKLKLMVVGDGPYKDELEKYTENLKIQNKVIFTGMVPPEKVHLYYQLGDIFVCASTSESQGLTYIEAMANGLPLICRNDPCLDNVVLQGKNGFLYENQEQFDSMLSLALNKEWRISAGEKSQAVAQKYDITTFGTSVEKIYLSVINGH